MQKSLTEKFRNLAVGDSLTFDIDKVQSIRSLASLCGLRWNRKYATSTDRNKRTLTVIRTK